MINKKDFYTKDDFPTVFQKSKMWKKISESIGESKKVRFRFDIKNFAMGFSFAIIMFFVIIGIYHATTNVILSDKPEIVKLNEAYYNAIKDFEQKSSIKTASVNYGINLDETFTERNEQLKMIDNEIEEFKRSGSRDDYSKLEQMKLNELYKMKLDVLSKLIELKEKNL